MSATRGRAIPIPVAGANAFPQADSLPRLLDVLAAAAHSPRLDEAVLAEQFSVTQRQGSYYASAATYCGLVYKRGGYIKPTVAGDRINGIADQAERRAAVFDIVLTLPVFSEVALHVAEHGCPPDAADVTQWVRTEDAKVNHTTAARRAETALAWIAMVHRERPEKLEELRPASAMRM